MADMISALNADSVSLRLFQHLLISSTPGPGGKCCMWLINTFYKVERTGHVVRHYDCEILGVTSIWDRVYVIGCLAHAAAVVARTDSHMTHGTLHSTC